MTNKAIAFALAFLAATASGAGDCEPGTIDDDVFFFQWAPEALNTLYTNPYSGDTVAFDDDNASVNTTCYDGGDGRDFMFMSSSSDILLLSDPDVPSPAPRSVEVFFCSDGHDVLILADAVMAYDVSPGPDGEVRVEAFGGGGNDIIWLNSTDDFISGSTGVDTIDGGPGDDEIYGDEDNDLVRGGDGDDIINGGSGVNTLYGDAGSDRFTISNGHGVSTIIEPPDGAVDRIEVSTNYSSEDVSFFQRELDLLVVIENGGKFIVADQFGEPGAGVDELVFNDGSPTIDLRAIDPPVVSPCPTDLDADCVTGAADLAVMLAAWGGPDADLDGDGATGASDLAILLAAWGDCV